MIFSLITYGWLVLCILSWHQPKPQLKTVSITEQKGRGYYQSRPFRRQKIWSV